MICKCATCVRHMVGRYNQVNRASRTEQSVPAKIVNWTQDEMVRVEATTSDHVTAWRVRDALASHPMLGGGTASICIIADQSRVVLEGWVMDAAVHELALKLAARSAGRRAVSTHISVENCRSLCTVSRNRTALPANGAA